MNPSLVLFAIQSSLILSWYVDTGNLRCVSFRHHDNLHLTLTNAGARCVSVAHFSVDIFCWSGLRMRWLGDFLAVALGLLAGLQPGTQAKVLFSTSPASAQRLLQEGFLIGNGRLGGMSFGSHGGDVDAETV